MSEPTIVKYIAQSTGIELWINPVSPFTFRAIRRKASEKYPDPDEAPFRLLIPNSAIEGERMPAKDNPEFVQLVTEQQKRRNSFVSEAVIVLACDPTPNKADLIARFAGQLIPMTQWLDLPEDAWTATLLHGILRGSSEPDEVSDLASEKLPLTPDEVQEGVAQFFRPDVSRKAARPLVRPAPGLQ